MISWQLDDTLELGFVLEAIAGARALALPTIWNTDQGSHCTSPQVIEPWLAAGVQMSMDGKGRARDTIFTERFWRSLKYEEVYLKEYDRPREARAGIDQYIQFYNRERSHQSLTYDRPIDWYQR